MLFFVPPSSTFHLSLILEMEMGPLKKEGGENCVHVHVHVHVSSTICAAANVFYLI